ncbi:lmo0937 family membrane protein [Curvibacter sp. HBC61]|uniref:Lmo0937 family membrane protein n=1 Tax=Curvibacter cyanobacteriorum TaxID=3026422 RepID=A0ABT5MZL6_9BURK|nr:lmo0937 family membrane protein [Curvibacter sp. HBC61]MDD0838764.1 lmo0937 family membrane protein [Curvibacter sp. HBC61]
MLYTLAAVLILCWALGLITSYTLGGLIHLFLVVALVMLLVSLLSGRQSL